MVGLVISGHRDLQDQDVLVIRKAITEFLGYRDFDEIVFGGARGADTLALETALEVRGAESWPKLIAVLPDVLSSQPVVTRPTTARADWLIELRHRITPNDNFWALRHRNEFMIDWVAPDGRLLAFWNGQRSGTAGAIRYAQTQLVEVSKRDILGIPRG